MSKVKSLLAATSLMASGLDTYSYPITISSSPIYYPHKHSIQSYRSQQRAAKARKRAK